jgi:fimbrial chaperone protein
VGYNGPRLEGRERTFRVFISEIPDQGPDAPTLAMALRLGVPVFVEPRHPKPAAELAALEVKDGKLRVTVANTGNVYQIAGRIEVGGRDKAGAETFRAEGNGWYVLSGAKRRFEVPLPEADCRRSAALEVVVHLDGREAKGRAGVPGPGACKPAAR